MRSLLVLICLSTLVLGGESPGVEEELANCRRLAEQGKAEAAIKAYDALFAAHPRDPFLLKNILDIEDDLKRCHFRRQLEPPTGTDLFGAVCKSFSLRSRKIVLEYPTTPSGALILQTDPDLWWLDLCFEGNLEIRMRTRTVVYRNHEPEPLFLGLCYDMRKSGGYVVYPGDAIAVPTAVCRVDEEGSVVLGEADAVSSCTDIEVVRRGTQIRVIRKGRTRVSVKDSTYRKGYVSFGNLLPDNLTIEGRLERAHLQEILATYEARQFEKWKRESWNPRAVLPEWAAREPVASAVEALRLPSKCEVEDPGELAELIDNCVNGDGSGVEDLEGRAGGMEGAGTRYLKAIVQYAKGSLKGALAELGALLAEKPGFAPALALRGMIRFDLRRFEEARADFVRARELAPDFTWPYLGLVYLAVRDNDYDGARSILEEGRKAGASSSLMDLFTKAIQRARRGPLWTRGYEVETSHFVIRSDHSRDLCREVAHLLEEALVAYARRFPFVRLPASKGRVYVFANRGGLLQYGSDRLLDLSNTAGSYDDALNELLLYNTVDHEAFVSTVRHEGFHWFMHAWLGRPPIWLNEGCAEYFSTANERFAGGFHPGATHHGHIRTIKGYRDYLSPMHELLVMEPGEFRKDADIHYAQAWLLVHFLFESKEKALADAMDGYLKGLGDGMSGREAYAEYFRPLLDFLEKGCWYHAMALDAE